MKEDCVSKKTNALYHIRGNVNEWLSIPGKAAGGSWRHGKSEIMQSDIFHITSADAYTGFRNVCEWVEWDGKFR